VNNIASFWQVVTTLAIVIVLFYGCSSSGAHPATIEQVFFTYYNSTGFDSPTYVVLLGILVAAYSFTGYEAGSHMAEEV
jgi:amino acid transporter